MEDEHTQGYADAAEPCDGMEAEGVPLSERNGWGCETTELIAEHYGVEFPMGPEDD